MIFIIIGLFEPGYVIYKLVKVNAVSMKLNISCIVPTPDEEIDDAVIGSLICLLYDHKVRSP